MVSTSTSVEADTANPSIEHRKASGLGKVPAFLGEDGFALSECIAIAIYGMSMPNFFNHQDQHGALLAPILCVMI